MVVNYDLPLMNERDKSADERPDIETYIHRIGQTDHLPSYLPNPLTFMVIFRSYRAVRA